jgi:hypothetical protein
MIHSRAHRLSHYYAIVDGYAKIVRFKPNSAQRHYYNRQHFCNHILKSRKLGFSTFNMMDALDAMLFISGTQVGVIDNTLPDAKKKLKMIRIAYENLDNPNIHPPEQVQIGKMLKKTIPMRYNTTEIYFGNGSEAYCGTSLRGSTPTRLYISELGKTAIFAPGKAEEIRTGALNSLVPGNLITIESTHEGGKSGMHYELAQTAIGNDPDHLSPLDFKFHFYPWWIDDRYELHDDKPLRPIIQDYFTRLEPQLPSFCNLHGFPHIPLTHAKKRFYDDKEKNQRHGMLKEFPSLPGECFEAPSEGAIYSTYLYDLRASGRLKNFHHNPNRPIFTSWDLGMSDATVIWALQLDGRDILWLNWFEDAGQGIGHYANVIRQWEALYGTRFTTHFLPHDAAQRDRFSAKTYVQNLAEAGIHNVTIVPRTTDVWHGINAVRELLPNSYFHAERTNTPRLDGTKELPSGFACLEGYHKRVSRDGITIQDIPVHDQFSHSADAARTFGDAHRLGLVDRLANPTPVSPTRIIKPRIIR